MNKVLWSSKSDLWSTPQYLFDSLDLEFHFNLDACAFPENSKCQSFISPSQNSLLVPWNGSVFCNPPYSRSLGSWISKARLSALSGSTVVLLLPARTDTSWFHDLVLPYAEVRFIRGRLYFGGSKSPAPFPSMICIFRPDPV